MEKEIAGKNLFMMCKTLNPGALTTLSRDYHVRTCRRDELEIWKSMPFDDPEVAAEFHDSMTTYFHDVYSRRESAFFQQCLFVCDQNDTPIATCFGWKSDERVSTVHWFKVQKIYEGLGIGRALLSIVMKRFADQDYPVYLHTQPGSFRAIKLYSDFGFVLLTDKAVGYRKNELAEGLPFLKAHMFTRDFARLRFARAPQDFLEAVKSSTTPQF